MEPELTRAVGRESCPAGGAFLRQQLEAGGGAEAEEQEERSGGWQHDDEVGLVQEVTARVCPSTLSSPAISINPDQSERASRPWFIHDVIKVRG